MNFDEKCEYNERIDGDGIKLVLLAFYTMVIEYGDGVTMDQSQLFTTENMNDPHVHLSIYEEFKETVNLWIYREDDNYYFSVTTNEDFNMALELYSRITTELTKES